MSERRLSVLPHHEPMVDRELGDADSVHMMVASSSLSPTALPVSRWWRRSVLASVALLGATAVPAVAVTPTTVPSTPPTSVVAAAPAAALTIPSITVVAAAKFASTNVYDRIGAKPIAALNNKTNFSGRHVFVVLEQQGDWFKVELPMRPNGRIGFVRTSDVTLYQHDYSMVVSLSAHTLTLYKSGAEVMRETVAVGSAKYPTPTGSFFLRELARPRNPKGAYGPWAFGLSAYSNVLQTFGRGDGQIGIHGTNEPTKLGQSVSHGCIRMSNQAITKLAQTLPQGVPLQIVA